MPPNFNITLWFPYFHIGAQVWVLYSILGFIRVLYIFKTTFASLELKFQIIQSIITFAIDMIDRIWLSALNVSSKPNSRSFIKFYKVTNPKLNLKNINHYQCLPHNSRRCPWCCRYRRRKWTLRHEFKSWTRLIAFPIALIPLGKVWIQSFSL